ncbi:MAG TPA: ABC transporter substrate-binding protein [Patescibacteria group bacterium]|nr:ABC transporter substrate-binding protein [Patescibacteria group bacterium]
MTIVLTGCTKKDTSVDFKNAEGGKYYGGTYRINMLRGNPNGLDPVIITSKLADDIAGQIYDRLISLDSNLNIIPELAKKWEISPDGKMYIFHLRGDVYFHDHEVFPNSKGRKVVAQDVVYSFTRACDPATRTAAFWAFKDRVAGATEYYNAKLLKKDNVGNVVGLKAIDDTTFSVELTRPFAPFLYTLVNAFGCVVPREAVEKYGQDYFKNPVGSGPFIFKEWAEDRHIILQKNPRYWQRDEAGNQLPLLDGIRITFVMDDKIQLEEFKKGELEENFTIPTEYFENVLNAQTKQPQGEYTRYIFQSEPALLTWFLDFLTTQKPFDNPDVRRAFSYAVDRDKIVRYVLKNSPHSAATNGITPPVLPGYDVSGIPGYTFNPQKARELLAKAGYPNGQGFPKVDLSIYQEPRLVQVAEAVQRMFAEVLNVNIGINQIQFSQLLDMAESGKLAFWGTRWYGDYPDAENYINLFDGSLVPQTMSEPSYPNSTRYNNPEVTRLLKEAVATTDNAQRNALYKQAETLAMQDAPALMLFYEMHYRFLQPYVRDYPLDAMNRVVLKRVWFDAEAFKNARK